MSAGSVGKMDEFPPSVVFEVREVEDRDATLKAGEYIGKKVNFAIITPSTTKSGVKDTVERVCDEWLTMLAANVRTGRFQAEWLKDIRSAYQAWLLGIPVPRMGMSLKDWEHCPDSQLKAFNANNITTVDELAFTEESQITRLGAAAMAVRAKAILFINQEPIPEEKSK